MTIRCIRRAAACAFLATTALSAPAFAQVAGSGTIFKHVDDNGVDVTSGAYELQIPVGKIGGNSPGALDLVEYLSGSSGESLQAYFRRIESGTQVTITLTYGAFAETFTGAASATSFISDQGTGATLTKVSPQEYTYHASDGSTASFTWPDGMSYGGGQAAFCANGNQSVCDLLPRNLTTPAGYGLTWDWHAGENCVLRSGEIYDCADFYRIQDIQGSGGWKVVLTYANDTDPTTYNLAPPDWFQRTGATFWNGATQVGSVSIAYTASQITQMTDIGGRTWQLTRDATTGYITGIRRPGSASDNITLQRDGNGKITQVIKDGVTTNYAWVDGASTRTLTITNVLNPQTTIRKTITSDMTVGRPSSIVDGLQHATGFTYDSNARLTRTTLPEGNYVNLTYDARGNVTERRRVAKSGSGLADIVETASYDATCANVVKCNKPNSTTDARGNVTDYTYDATHGGLLTLTKPAPTTGAVRPQLRYSYTQIPAGGPYMPTGISQCQTLASCTGAADESKLTAAYNSATLLPTNLTRANGTGTLSAISAMTYDNWGNLSTVDGPLAGTVDTTKYEYDSANQLVGVMSPDPDGAGVLKNRAIRLTYRPDGQVSKQEVGTTVGQTDTAWSNFSSLQTVDVTFDSNNRPITYKLSAGGAAYALTQTNYDALGRVDCTAVRMNTAAYGALPTSACTLSTQGSFGADRINETLYDAAGQVTDKKVGLGTTEATTERHLAYTNNGLVSTLTDAEDNLTTFTYDGHDRLSKTSFPSLTKGSGTSSTTDYEQLTYDPSTNITSRRLRDGTSIALTYDNLDRITLKDLPGTEPDVSYAYDNLNRVTSASQTGSSLTFAWDALGRRTDETGAEGTTHSDYDLADRRTAVTYPGTGLVVNYDYLLSGDLSAVRENGANSGVGILASYAYDDLGNRTSATFGNGVAQTYSFDPVSRLTTLTNDLASTTNDLTVGGATTPITYNPASQITSTPRSNNNYAFGGLVNVNRNYSSNGLNQYSTVASANFSYDTKGNLTSDGVNTYTYSSENLLKTAPGSVTLSYDPGLRLTQIAGASTTRFAYDGSNMLAEYNGTDALQRRFVFDDAGQPIVQYEGTDTSNRRFLSTDERATIISATDSSGALIGINAYDEYGIPGSGNIGRFQYTGQAWLSEIGMQYSRARIYSPTLGRFLQTDPIGYDGDGPNLYAYVLNDPVNYADPLGLGGCPSGTWVCGKRLSDGGGGGAVSTTVEGGGRGGQSEPGGGCVGDCRDIVITAKKANKSKPVYCALFRNSPGVVTVGIGGSGSVKLPGNIRASANISGGIAIGGNWDVALFGTGGGGPTTAGNGAAGGLVVGGSKNAQSIRDLRGFFSYVGGQLSGFSASRFAGYGANTNRVTGVESTIGVGVGKSGSAGGTNTWMSGTINIMEVIGC